jgi:tetratricopeptide (TPR) repeat protein
MAVVVTLLAVFQPVAAEATPQQSARKASVLSEQAVKFSLAGKHALALELFKQAYQLDPYLGYLYSAARAAHKAKMYEDAKRDYQLVINQAKPDDPFHLKATHHHKTLLKEPKVPSPKPADSYYSLTKKEVQASKPAPKEPTKALPIGVMAGGGTLMGVGVILEVLALSDQSDLDSHKISTKPIKYKGITFAEARTQQESINSSIVAGWVLVGVGTAGAAAGAWLYLRTTSAQKVAVWPSVSRHGVAFNVRF